MPTKHLLYLNISPALSYSLPPAEQSNGAELQSYIAKLYFSHFRRVSPHLAGSVWTIACKFPLAGPLVSPRWNNAFHTLRSLRFLRISTPPLPRKSHSVALACPHFSQKKSISSCITFALNSHINWDLNVHIPWL